MSDEYLVLTFDDVWNHTFLLADKISKSFKPDVILAISRGGLVIARILSDILDIKNLLVIGVGFYTDIGKTNKEPILLQKVDNDLTNKNILLVDDVSDSGKTLVFTKDYLLEKNVAVLKTVTIHFKPKSILKPDYFIGETNKWIVYPWECVEFSKQFVNKRRDAGIKEDLIRKELLGLKLPKKVIDNAFLL